MFKYLAEITLTVTAQTADVRPDDTKELLDQKIESYKSALGKL